jgi:hypothetical protein
MNFYFTAAAILTLAVSLAHSLLGEQNILIRLFRRQNLPHLFGSDVFTKRTLRFAWHITSVSWCGLAVSLLALALLPLDTSALILSKIIAVTFLASSIVVLIGSRGRHLAWVVFLVIAGLVWIGGR